MNRSTFKQCTRGALAGAMLLLLTGCGSSQVKKADPYAQYTETQIHEQAQLAIQAGNYDEVTQALRALDRHFPFGKKAESSLLNGMYAYYKADKIDAALAETDRYLRLYPHGKRVDYVYFFRGVINFNRSGSWLQHKLNIDPALRDLADMRKAMESLHQLTTLFPKSSYVKPARKLMFRIRRILAQHEVEVAEYYAQHHAYIASANRAAEVIKHAQGTPQALRALEILQNAYEKLGQHADAQRVAQILALNQKRAMKP